MISPSGTPSSQSRIRIISVPPLNPRGPLARVGTRGQRASSVIGEGHGLSRRHPSTDDAAREPDEQRSRRGRSAGRRRFGSSRIHRLSRLCGHRRRRREGQIPAARDRASKTREGYEDHELIWESKPGEDYPWRLKIAPDVVLDEGDWIPSEAVGSGLVYVQKWPAEHWKLAFQGNLHQIPDGDFETLRAALAAAGGNQT